MFYLAIDAGGTKTECAIADESRVLGRASGASVKITRIPRSDAYANLEAVIADALAQAEVGPQDISRSCAGTAGASIPEVRDWMAESLARLVSGEAILTTDTVIALEAAFHGGPGVLAVSGTGSSVLGRNQLGLTARAGGWGPLVSDEGSAHWIGRAAVSAAMRESDRGNTSALLTAILRYWHLKSTSELVTLCNTLPPPRFGDLAPRVMECAAAGDKQAAELLTRAGHELAELVGIVVQRLWGTDDFARVIVACAGGVLENADPVRRALESRLRETMPQAEVKPNTVDPIAGALWIARQGSSMLRSRTEAMPVPDSLRKR